MQRGRSVDVRRVVPRTSPSEADDGPRGRRPAGEEPGGSQPEGPSTADAEEVHRFVARRVANPADAEDIAQQTLLQALSKWGSCRAASHRPWLFTIARHLVVDHYRARGRYRFVEAGAVAEVEPALQTGPEAVHEGCVARQRMGCLESCLARRLPLEEQAAVLLADVHGQGNKESARTLGMSLPSFKLLLHEARARLREAAGGSCFLVAKKNGAACERPAGGRRGERSEPAREAPLARTKGVVCPLGLGALVELRRRLLGSLKLLGLDQLVTDALLDAEPLLEVVVAFC